EDVTKMAAATTAVRFGADHAIASVRRGPNRARLGLVEAWPAGAAFELLLRDEQGLVAARADEGPGALLKVERTAAGRLRAVLSHDRVLLVCQQLAPLRLGSHHRVFFCLHGELPWHCLNLRVERTRASAEPHTRLPQLH